MTNQELEVLKKSLKDLKETMSKIESNTTFMSKNEKKAKEILEAIDQVLHADQYFKVTK